MANNYQKSVDKAKSDLDELTSKLIKMQSLILENAKAFNSISVKNGSESIKDFQNKVNSLDAQLKKLNDTKKETIVIEGQIRVKQSELANSMIALSKQREKEEIKISKVNKERVKEADRIEKTKQALLRQKESSLEMSRAYVKLVNAQKNAKKTLQDLIVTKGKNNRETIKAQKNYNNLTEKVNKANKATSNFSKTGLGSMVRGFRNLLGAFGIIGGIQILSSITKEVFKLTREINSLSFSMKAVIKDTIELSQTQEWLKDITNRFGADIVSTTKRYIKFRAASKEANLTASETQKIFGTVTKAAGVLGLKTDELTGIYLALEQMISKGKVTTEELRRQLGERLPGAFDIMAKAIGVSTSELDKMLKKGEILSAEALPKFVVELEKAYGIESVNKVDTMVAAQIRMNNAWKNLVISVEKDSGVISNFFRSEFQYIADFMNQIEKINKSQSDMIEFSRAEEYKRSLKDVKTEWETIVKLNEEQANFGKRRELTEKDYLSFLLREKEIQEGVVGASNEDVKLIELKRKELKEANDELNNYGSYENIQKRNTLKIELENLEKKERILAVEKGRLDAIKELIKLENKPKLKSEITDGDGNIDNQAKKQKDLFDFEKYLLEQKIKRSKENAEDDKNTFKERNGYLEEFHNQSVELNKMIVNNEINELKRKRIEIQNDSELTISQKKELLNEISDLQLKADIEQKNRASQHSKDMAKIRDDIRSDVFSEIKKDLEEQKKFAEFSRNQELADAQGDKEKIKEINDRYNKAMLESQMQYLDEVFLNTEGITESQKKIILNMINEIQIQLNKGKEDVKNNLKEIQDVAKDIFATLTDSFSNVFNIDTSKFNFIFDEISKGFDKSEETMSKLFSKENISAWADASKEIIGGVLNASLQRYEIELQQAQIFRDQILNDDLSTEEQKVAARRKFEEEERRIKTERAKQERENTLIQIAVDTAASVAKVLSQTGVIAPFVIPSIVAIGLAQAALVSSQPLPKFEHGTDNAPEGWAITQEKRAEPIVDKHGNLKTMGSKRGDSLTYLQKGDKVFKSREHFFKEFDIDNIQRAVFQMNTSSNGDILSQKIIDNSLLREVGGLRKDIDTMGRRIEKIASRPISNNVKVELKDQRPY